MTPHEQLTTNILPWVSDIARDFAELRDEFEALAQYNSLGEDEMTLAIVNTLSAYGLVRSLSALGSVKLKEML